MDRRPEVEHPLPPHPRTRTLASVCSLSMALCSRTIPTYSFPAMWTKSSEGGLLGFMCSHASKPDDTHARLTGTLLGFDQSRGSIYADDEAASDLGV